MQSRVKTETDREIRAILDGTNTAEVEYVRHGDILEMMLRQLLAGAKQPRS